MNSEELLAELVKIDYTPSGKDSDERSTPDDLYKMLDDEFHFTLDVCATHENTKCLSFYNKIENGLQRTWRNEICFMNPPYSNIPVWLEKAEFEAKNNHTTVVCILPCDTSTSWFHDYLWFSLTNLVRYGVELRFPKGRFKFGKYTTSPQFATIIAVFRPPTNLYKYLHHNDALYAALKK